MRYASVCDGIGAAHVAWQPLGWECAWTSEIEPFPSAVVDERWKLKNVGDMTKLTEEQLENEGPISLLVGGTPCQSFSVAGLRKGLEDPRGNLALRFTQLVGVLRPTWVVWENVPGVLSSGGGRDFGTFLGALAELGYGFAYRVLDAQWFGVAQRRRRVFVVAHARDWRRAAAVLFERESVFGNPPTRGKAGQKVTGPIAGCSNGGGANGPGRTADDADTLVTSSAIPQVDNPLTARMGKGINTTCDEGQTAVVAFHPTQDPISSVDGLTHSLGCGSSRGCATAAVAFAQNTRDEVRRVNGDGDIVGALAAQPGMKQTSFVAYDITGIRATVGGRETDCHTALRSRAPGQSEASTTTVVAIQERAVSENPDAGPDGAGIRTDGVSYTLEARTVPQAVMAYGLSTTVTPKFAEELSPTIVTPSPSGGGQPQCVAFANRTRDGIKVPEIMKDGIVPALTNPGKGGRSDAVNVAVALQDCSGREKRQNGTGWNQDGTAYTVDAAATQGVAIDLQNVSVGGDVAGTLDTTRPSRGGGQAVVAFKPGQSEAAGGTFVTEEFAPTIQAQNNGSTAVPAVAFNAYQRTEQQAAWPLGASDGRKVEVGVREGMAVRRLTPRECERLQGFPDDYTLVSYRNKPAADGPRYKALGNSMAVPVMRWIGERIALVDSVEDSNA